MLFIDTKFQGNQAGHWKDKAIFYKWQKEYRKVTVFKRNNSLS